MIGNIVDGLRLTKVFGGSADTDKLAALDAEINAKTRERNALAEDIRNKTEFAQVLPDRGSDDIHRQLLENERVHQVKRVDDLVHTRIGEPQDNKRCFVRMVEKKKPGRFIGRAENVVTAGIFTALIPVEKDGDVTFADVPGNINQVLDMPVEAFSAPKNPDNTTVFAILYTISSKRDATWEQSGGRMLAGAVFTHLHEEARERGYKLVVSTLSPIHDFAKWYSAQPDVASVLDASDKKGIAVTEEFLQDLKDRGDRALDEMRRHVLRYLLTEKDGVANFHLGNGACIGDVKFNLDNPRDWVMVNYVYPDSLETLQAQQTYYKETKRRLLAPHLQRDLGYDPELQAWATVLLEDPFEANEVRWNSRELVVQQIVGPEQSPLLEELF